MNNSSERIFYNNMKLFLLFFCLSFIEFFYKKNNPPIFSNIGFVNYIKKLLLFSLNNLISYNAFITTTLIHYDIYVY